MTPPCPSWPWWRRAVTGLGAAGLALSGYLGWHHIAGGTVIGCVAGSSCDLVLGSRWSAIGGVLPVSGLAAGVYLAVLLASFYLGPATEAPVRRLAWRALLVLTGAAAGSAVWFTIVQKWMIGAFCPYCMATHLTGVLLAGLVFWHAPGQLAPEPAATPEQTLAPPSPARGRVAWSAAGPALAGVALSGLMAVAQVAFAPAAFSRAGEAPSVLPAINPRAVPLIGPPDARHVVSVLFDYNCPHCQRLHAMLDEAVARDPGRLAFALFPVPLNTGCNPFVARNTAAFKDSCELARLALAVWVARREAFAEFDRWMFSPEPGHLWRPRDLAAVKAKAAELAGQARLEAALADPWIDRHVQAGVGIFGATGGNAVPELVFGPHWTTPEPKDTDDLLAMLQANLGVTMP